MQHNVWVTPKLTEQEMEDGSMIFVVALETLTFRTVSKEAAHRLIRLLSFHLFSIDCICEEKIGDPVIF